MNNNIEKSYLAVFNVVNALLVLACGIGIITTLLQVLYIKMISYEIWDENLVIKKGVLNRKTQIIPLYRIVDISSHVNIFNYGTIMIMDKTKIIKLTNVKHPVEDMNKLIDHWAAAKVRKNVHANEII